MGLKYEFHKWPFEQRKQIISQLTFQFAKKTQINTFPAQTGGFAHTRVSGSLATWVAAVHASYSPNENTFSKPSESSRIRILFKEQVNNHIFKREPKGKMKDPSQTNERTSPDSVQENPRGTQRAGTPSAHGCHTCWVILSFPV